MFDRVEATRFYGPRRTLLGCGSLGAIAAEAERLNAGRVLIVTDAGLMATDIVDQVKEQLASLADLEVFSNVQPNPTTVNVAEGLEALGGTEGRPVIVGVGGGSALDAAKAIAALATNGGSVQDYDGVDLLKHRMLPMIAVNTTAGTGSEVTKVAVITDPERKWKLQIVDEHVTPDVAIDDPLLTVGLPPAATAETGMDALTHAIEGLVGRNGSYLTRGLALTAIELVFNHLPVAFAEGANIEARSAVMYGQATAGLAFTNAGVGNVHAMAHQLGAVYDLPHGLANAVILPYVMEFNLIARVSEFSSAAKAMGVASSVDTDRDASVASVRAVLEIRESLGIPRTVGELGVPESDLPMLVDKSMMDGCVGLNPRDTSREDMEDLWDRAYHGTLLTRPTECD